MRSRKNQGSDHEIWVLEKNFINRLFVQDVIPGQLVRERNGPRFKLTIPDWFTHCRFCPCDVVACFRGKDLPKKLLAIKLVAMFDQHFYSKEGNQKKMAGQPRALRSRACGGNAPLH